MTRPNALQITATVTPEFDQVLTSDALALVADLYQRFEGCPRELLRAQDERQARLDGGEQPDSLPQTLDVRLSAGSVAWSLGSVYNFW